LLQVNYDQVTYIYNGTSDVLLETQAFATGFSIGETTGNVWYLQSFKLYILEFADEGSYGEITATTNVTLSACFFNPLRKLITDDQKKVTVYSTFGYGRIPFKTTYSVLLPEFDNIPVPADATITTLFTYTPSLAANVNQFDYKDITITVSSKNYDIINLVIVKGPPMTYLNTVCQATDASDISVSNCYIDAEN
jgi:hypothetical protein